MSEPMSDERRYEIDAMWTGMPLGDPYEPELGELLDEVDRLRAELARKDKELATARAENAELRQPRITTRAETGRGWT